MVPERAQEASRLAELQEVLAIDILLRIISCMSILLLQYILICMFVVSGYKDRSKGRG
jgi:hypothetical protein